MKIINADVYRYHDGPIDFVGVDTDSRYGQLVYGCVTNDTVSEDERVFDVYSLPPNGEPAVQVKESEIGWRE